jgi:hypothetical protein
VLLCRTGRTMAGIVGYITPVVAVVGLGLLGFAALVYAAIK